MSNNISKSPWNLQAQIYTIISSEKQTITDSLVCFIWSMKSCRKSCFLCHPRYHFSDCVHSFCSTLCHLLAPPEMWYDEWKRIAILQLCPFILFPCVAQIQTSIVTGRKITRCDKQRQNEKTTCAQLKCNSFDFSQWQLNHINKKRLSAKRSLVFE